MPKKVPTSAAPTSPICSAGPSMAPIVITIPSTAATMPKPGMASAVFANTPKGTWCSSSSKRMSASSSPPIWSGFTVPSKTGDRAPQAKSTAWWLPAKSGYLAKIVLSSVR